jgi:putative peptide zinc metalloprotease protein
MQKSLLSPAWYRVANLRPLLRPHVELSRQHYRGQLWFVLEDHANNRFHRFAPAAQQAVTQMDGSRSIDEIWQSLDHLGDERPTQDEFIQLLAQLDGADLLSTDQRPDLSELSYRAQRQARSNFWRRFANPLYLRLPLIDPDRFLTATVGIARPFWSIWGVLLWLGVVGWGATHAALNWDALTTDLADRVLARDNILILVLTFPVLKLLHELGHGYATKICGGQVHEAGIMTLVIMPVPYVDVSASAAFRSRWERAAVGAAGMLVETFCAGLAMMVWTSVEQGPLRAAAFNVLLIAGVSTLVFNGNPLLRFDAYYILSDLLEIPNLGTRATKFWGYLCRRYLFGNRDESSPATAPGETFWFSVYAPLSYAYRMSVMFSIALFVAGQLRGLGAVLAIWTVATGVLLPLGRNIWFLLRSPSLRRNRIRALAVTGFALACAVLLLFGIPLPYGTVTEGVVWASPGAEVHAGAEGHVDALLAKPNQMLATGAPIATLSDPLLDARFALLQAQLHEIQLRYAAVEYTDQTQASILREQASYFTSEVKEARARRADLNVTSPAAGRFLVDTPADFGNKYVRRGELIGYVLDPRAATVRIIVPQSEIELVRQDTRDISLRLASDPEDVYHAAAITRQVPTATRTLPSAALSTGAGGTIEVDPADDKHVKALEIVFLLDVQLPPEARIARIGERVHVRFDHGARTIGWRLSRDLRQVFLKRFDL